MKFDVFVQNGIDEVRDTSSFASFELTQAANAVKLSEGRGFDFESVALTFDFSVENFRSALFSLCFLVP